MSNKHISEIIDLASVELGALCHNDKKFTMCIPVQSTDSDVIFGDMIRYARVLQQYVEESMKEEGEAVAHFGAWAALHGYDLDDHKQREAAVVAYGEEETT